MPVIRINPKSAQAHQHRGRARGTKGEFDKALDDYDAAIRQRHWGAEGYQLRAWLKATCPVDEYRDGAAAVLDVQKACDLTGWDDPRALHILAAAYAESADIENALKWAQRAQELSPDETKEGLDAFLDLDRERKPFRTTTGE